MASAKLSKMFGAQDMTQGDPMHSIIQFSIPLLVGNIAQQLYSTVDSVVVGKYVGDNALAAIGASGPIINLLLVLYMGIAAGAGIMVSQYYGARDRARLSKTVGNCLTLTLISALLFMTIGLLSSRGMLTILNTPAEIFEDTNAYLVITFYGFIAVCYYNIIAGILRGMGDSISPLIFLLITCGINVVLDLLFVAGLGWGVAGAAWATIIAQAISAVLCMIKLFKMNDLDMSLDAFKLDGSISARIFKLGVPSGVTQAIFSMAMLVVQTLTNSFGAFIITCNTIIMRVDGFAMMPNFTFGMAMTTYTGQNVGAHMLDRVDQGTRAGLKLSLIVSISFTALILIFGKFMFGLFTNTQHVIDMAMNMMSIIAAGYIAVAVTQVISGVMRGAGDTMTPMWVSIITTVIMRVPVAYLCAYLTRSAEWPNGHPYSLNVSLLLSWLVGMIITIVLFKRGKWRQKAEDFYSAQSKHPQ